MKKLMTLYMIFFMTSVIMADKIATLPQVMKPFHLKIGNNRLYISEETSKIHIYQFDYQSKKLKFLKTFGTKGQGPGEFTFIHNFKILKDRLIVPTRGKYAEFTLDGEFIKETKVTAPVFKNKIEAVEGNYVTGNIIITGGDRGRTTSRKIRLYDKGFNLIKDLKTFAYDNKGKPINIFSPLCTFSVYDKKIYLITADKEAKIEILNRDGNQVKQITLPISKMRITEEMNKNRMVYYKQDLGQDKEQWKRIEKMIFLPPYCPPLEYAWVCNDRIYVKTYRRQEGLAEFLIHDLNGNKLKSGFVYNTGPLYRGQLFSFINNDLIYLKMDEEEEFWELHRERVGD